MSFYNACLYQHMDVITDLYEWSHNTVTIPPPPPSPTIFQCTYSWVNMKIKYHIYMPFCTCVKVDRYFLCPCGCSRSFMLATQLGQ